MSILLNETFASDEFYELLMTDVSFNQINFSYEMEDKERTERLNELSAICAYVYRTVWSQTLCCSLDNLYGVRNRHSIVQNIWKPYKTTYQ